MQLFQFRIKKRENETKQNKKTSSQTPMAWTVTVVVWTDKFHVLCSSCNSFSQSFRAKIWCICICIYYVCVCRFVHEHEQWHWRHVVVWLYFLTSRVLLNKQWMTLSGDGNQIGEWIRWQLSEVCIKQWVCVL